MDSVDLIQSGVQALVMNTFHLMQHPGSSTVQALGGLVGAPLTSRTMAICASAGYMPTASEVNWMMIS